MPRTMISRRWLPLVMLAAACIAGCSGEYRQRQVDSDDARAAEVRGMIQSLRSAGEGDRERVARDSSVPDLDDRQASYLLEVLERVASADSAELERLDRFGRDVYRATILLDEGGDERRIPLLLSPVQGELRWARPN